MIAAPGSVAEFSCEVEPHNTEVCWYNGSNTLKNGDKYQIISQGKTTVYAYRMSFKLRDKFVKNFKAQIILAYVKSEKIVKILLWE